MVGLNHAEDAVNGPEEEEDDEEMVSVPESLELFSACLLFVVFFLFWSIHGAFCMIQPDFGPFCQSFGS